MGILLAVLAVIPMGVDYYLSDFINLEKRFGFSIGQIGGLSFFALILFTIYLFATKAGKDKK